MRLHNFRSSTSANGCPVLMKRHQLGLGCIDIKSDSLANSALAAKHIGVRNRAFLAATFRYQAHAVIKPSIPALLSIGFLIALMPVFAGGIPEPVHSPSENVNAFD